MNKCIKCSWLVAFLLLVKLPGYGQEKFREGYIVTLQQDTVYGLIDYKTVSKSANKCSFRKDRNANVVTYTPDQIMGYRFTSGKYYVSKLVKMNGGTEELFLEYLIDGIADIYFFRDEAGDHYYIEKEGEEILPLVVDVVEVEREGKRYFKRKDAYKQVLKYTFSDASGLSDEINSTDLRHDDLIEIAENYHNQVCDEYECITYSKRQSVVQTRVGLLIGGSASDITFTNMLYVRPELLANLPTSNHITFGTFLRIKDTFIGERFSLQSELWYGRTRNGRHSAVLLIP
ncbi:MAG: hypothetical protein WBA23_08140 [Tunicatimonas sp.]|uniref:hypothetical protein n=1 Tax=Tunicatimonas sp. TaxID=1940096 RepID=UPI003C707C14